MNPNILFPLTAILALILACSAPSTDSRQESKTDLVSEVFDLMSGTFSSEAQALADSEFYHINLVMHPIWEDNTDAKWLYVEQAVASALDRPYRQRVYRLALAEGGAIESRVYELPQPDSFVHAWDTPELFSTLSPNELIIRKGCSVYLEKNEDCFEGSTNKGACQSTLRGASYATSTVKVCKEKLVSWDQGWNESGEQVWGAEKGGYVFDRIQ